MSLSIVILAVVVVAAGAIIWALRKQGQGIFDGDRRALEYLRDSPPVMRRWEVWFIVALVPILLVAVARLRSRRAWFGLGDYELPMLAAGLLLLVFIPLMGIYFVRRRRWQDAATEADYAICPECGYSLKGLPARHACPECGKPYDLSAVQRQWHRHLGA